MEMSFLKNLKQTARYWWVGLLVGALLLILGMWSITVPVTTLISLSIIFIVGFIFTGITDIVYAITIRKDRNDWGWTLAAGIISLFLGLLLAARPQLSFLVLLLYVGFWAVFQSVITITASIVMQKNRWKGWGWLLFFGVLGVVFAFFLITHPVFASSFIVVLFSFSIITYGMSRIYYAIQLKRLHQILKNDHY